MVRESEKAENLRYIETDLTALDRNDEDRMRSGTMFVHVRRTKMTNHQLIHKALLTEEVSNPFWNLLYFAKGLLQCHQIKDVHSAHCCTEIPK